MLKTAPLILALAVAFASAGCEQKKTAAQEKVELDKLKKEERKQKAAKFYEDLVKKFPDSEFAEQAKKRLQALGPVGTPGGKATPKPAH
jgi:outer membrane protein assembly factor BamD (BamD/ComL family)